jgi:hypothetical protein
MDFLDYQEAVLFHLIRLREEEEGHTLRQPTNQEMAEARNQGMSPRKYAEWWVRKQYDAH